MENKSPFGYKIKKKIKQDYLADVKGKALLEKIKIVIEERIHPNSFTSEEVISLLSVFGEIIHRVNHVYPFSEQYETAYALYQNKVVDMKTGEGKSIATILAAALFALEGKEQIFIVSVNEYLTNRDYHLFTDFFTLLDITHSQVKESDSREDLLSKYKNTIVFVHNTKLIQDYIDNIVKDDDINLDIHFDVVMVDEIDSILIDEGGQLYNKAISIEGVCETEMKKYLRFAKELSETDYYFSNEVNKYLLTDDGVEKAVKHFKLNEDYYSYSNYSIREEIGKALSATYRYSKDKDYILLNEEVFSVDKTTGRVDKGTRMINGIHRYIEAKENVSVKNDLKSICSISYAQFYQKFNTLCGLSGTIDTESKDMRDIYNKEIVSIERRQPLLLKKHNDVICKTNEERFTKVIEKINECNKKGQPVLCITKTIEDAEQLFAKLDKNKKPTLLTAKNHFEEAEILRLAGKLNAITIATVMAGRGVDILVEEKVNSEKGGLFIIGFEHFNTKRIDNQLIGRTCRQGAPGECQFFVSLEEKGFISKQLASLSVLESKLGTMSKRSFADEEVKKMVDSFQIDSEQNASNNRLLVIDLFSSISEECMSLFSQKKQILIADEKGLLDIIKNILKKEKINNVSLTFKDNWVDRFKKDAVEIINKRWICFYDFDRTVQQQLLSKYGSTQEFVLQYKESNLLRWENLITGIREELIQQLLKYEGGNK